MQSSVHGREPMEGTLLAARYRILRRLAQGGMSTVYLARDEHFPRIDRLCAIKVMRASEDPTLAQLQHAAFEREASLLATLRHPAIPEVYDFFLQDGRCCLVLEYIEGEDLERYLARTGAPVPEEVLIGWALQILDVLHFLHTQRPHPIVFRDLKPSNIMLREDGSLVLIDFGIARLFQPTARGTMIGTEGYAPPEQYRGIADPRGDLYALGATLYHLATGIDPRDLPPFALSQQPPRSVNPHLSPGFERVILRALAYDPAERYPDAATMAQALRALESAHLEHPRTSTTLVQSPSRPLSLAHSERLRLLWTIQTQDEVRASPLRVESLVVFGSYDGRVYGVDHRSGEVRWLFTTGRGIATRPARYHHTVIVGSDDGAVYTVRWQDGSLVWRYRTAGAVRSSPVVVADLVVFGSDDGCIYALDAATGSTLWRRQARGPVRATPLAIADAAVVTADDETLALRTLPEGHLVWRCELGGPTWGCPARFRDTVIAASITGTVVSVECATGTVLWRRELPDAFVASPILIGETLLVAGNSGELFALHPENGQTLWQLSLEQRIASDPVAVGQAVLVATGQGDLVTISLSGEVSHRDTLGSGVVSTPLVDCGMLYIGDLDGRFSAFALCESRTEGVDR